MPFDRPTLTEIDSRISSNISTLVTGGANLLRRSVLKILAKVFAGAVHLLYSYLGFQAEQLHVTTADVEGLEDIADEYGINRQDATYATGTATATGTNDIEIPISTELQTESGVKYTVDESITIASGTATLSLTASEAGEDGNQDGSISLTFISPISGVDTSVTVSSSGLVSGTNEETDDELRNRVLRRKQFPPYGGCEYDYKQWMLEYSGVTRAWAFSGYQGDGTVGCTFMMDNSTPSIPTTAILDLVEAYIIEHVDPISGRTVGIPIGAVNGLFMIELTAQPLNMSIGIYPNTSAVQNDINDELDDLILREGGPGETIYLSDILIALSRVSSLERFNLLSPVSNISANTDKIHTLGTITFSDYS